MIRAYTKTLFHPSGLEDANVFLNVYNHTKYEAHEFGEEAIEFKFKGLVGWDIIEGGEEADEIERDSDLLDEYHEYLVLHFANGITRTYRNSHVVLFIL